MKKKLLIAAVLIALASTASAFFVSLDAPQEFPVNI